VIEASAFPLLLMVLTAASHRAVGCCVSLPITPSLG
jgi:hypothetical protein